MADNARSYSAAAKTTKGLSPLDWGDSCFLCGRTIGEGEPIGFYQGRNANARCHRGCLNQMEMVGGTPKAFHEFHASKKQAPAFDKPVHQDVVSEQAMVEVPIKPVSGPRAIKFDDLQHMQTFIAARGPIPATTRVLIGDYVIQAVGSYLVKGVPVRFASRDIAQASDAEIALIGELVSLESRDLGHGREIEELVIESDYPDRDNVRYTVTTRVLAHLVDDDDPL